MNLSRLILNPYDRLARRDLASPYELHRTLVTRGFPEGPPAESRMLFRVETSAPGSRQQAIAVLVQCSKATPDWTHFPEDYCLRIDGPQEIVFRPIATGNESPADMKASEIAIGSGQRFDFRLLANPVRRIRTGQRSAGSTRKPDGHDRYRREAILDEETQRKWLCRQGGEGGFRPLYLHTVTSGVPREKPSVRHIDKRSIPHVGVRFEGLLEVTDPEAFARTIENGVGAAKAFGFGLLSLAKPV